MAELIGRFHKSAHIERVSAHVNFRLHENMDPVENNLLAAYRSIKSNKYII